MAYHQSENILCFCRRVSGAEIACSWIKLITTLFFQKKSIQWNFFVTDGNFYSLSWKQLLASVKQYLHITTVLFWLQHVKQTISWSIVSIIPVFCEKMLCCQTRFKAVNMSNLVGLFITHAILRELRSIQQMHDFPEVYGPNLVWNWSIGPWKELNILTWVLRYFEKCTLVNLSKI